MTRRLISMTALPISSARQISKLSCPFQEAAWTLRQGPVSAQRFGSAPPGAGF